MICTLFVNIGYVVLTLTHEYCQLTENNNKHQACSDLINSDPVTALFGAFQLLLSLYSVVLDFIFGTILLVAILRVPMVKKVLQSTKGFEYRDKYLSKFVIIYSVWALLLVLSITLSMLNAAAPVVYSTKHISLIVNALTQLINTCQFLSAFEFMAGIELLMKIGTNRMVQTVTSGDVPFSARDDPSSDPPSDAEKSKVQEGGSSTAPTDSNSKRSNVVYTGAKSSEVKSSDPEQSFRNESGFSLQQYLPLEVMMIGASQTKSTPRIYPDLENTFFTSLKARHHSIHFL